LCSVAQAGPPVPDDQVDQQHQEDLVRQFARTVSRETSQARHDAISFEKILEVRRLLLSQLGTP
jgi:hypothetical protein